MTSTLRPSLWGLAASRRLPAMRPPRALLVTKPFTREQKFLRRKAPGQPLPESRPRPGPAVSVTVANFLARQKPEERKEKKAEEKDFLLNDIRDLEAEIEASEIDLARSELSRTAITSLCCRGCGVPLQTEAPSSPGFVEPRLAAEALSGGASPAASGLVCRRCLLLKFAGPLRTRVAPVEAEELQKIFNSIRELPRATILVVVDVLDIEGSCIPDLYSRLGPHHYVLVGNKVDQLLPDGSGYLTRWSDHLRDRALALTDIDPERLVSSFLISARTGYNLEPLVTQLLAVKLRRQPTYIVGCANVGKSSLFNRLLNSDFCKESARVPTPEATVSSWPGTTASILYFHITTMTTEKQRLRNARLSRDSKLVKISNDPTDPAFLRPLAGHVGRSFSHPMVLIDQHQGFKSLPTYRYDGGALVDSVDTKKVVEERFLQSRGHDEWEFSAKKMCSDTPGYVSEKQLANFLTAKENAIIQGGGKRRLLPRTFSLRPGLSLLLGGIARLDYCEGPSGLLLTTQTHLPIHIVESHHIEDYLSEFSAALQVPDVAAGPDERPAALPAMAEHEMTLSLYKGAVTSEADVVFSGIGWVAVAPPIMLRQLPNWRQKKDLTNRAMDEELLEIRLRGHFPKGLPCLVRRPALCPRAVLQRAGRLPHLQEFRQPPYLTSYRHIEQRLTIEQSK